MVHHLTLALAVTRLRIFFAMLAIGFASEQTTTADDASIEDGEVTQSVKVLSYDDVSIEGDEEIIDEPQNVEIQHESSEAWAVQEVDETMEEDCEVCRKVNQACRGVCRDPGHPAKPKRELPGDIDEGDCPSKRYRMDDCQRSGSPNCVYKWAVPSITDKYSAWYSGGGAVFKGRGRTAEDGTWGLDYSGLFGHAKTWMNYTCGKYQGGEGAYEGEHVPLKKKLHAGR